MKISGATATDNSHFVFLITQTPNHQQQILFLCRNECWQTQPTLVLIYGVLTANQVLAMAQLFILIRRPAKKTRYDRRMASIQSFTDPTGSSALVNAVQWLQGTLLGTIASTVAVIAVAVVGVQMLFGRISYRRGVNVVIGCFVLFGATSIVAGIRSTIAGENPATGPVRSYAPSPLPPAMKQAPMPAYDPYAGASVPSG